VAPDIPDNDDDRRDRPLTHHWKVSRDIIRRLGVKETGKRDFDASLRAILTEAVLAHEAGQWVSYSRRKAFYAGLDRYHGTAYTYANVLGGVAEGVRLGLLDETRALPGDHQRTGLQSTFRATPALIEGYRGAELEYELRGLIRLRNKIGDLIGFSDTRETRRMARELERINTVLRGVVLTVTSSNVTRNGRTLVITRDGKVQHIQQTTSELYRIFGRSSFTKGGRLIGWWQSLPKDVRENLTINGEPVVEPDFAAMHANILYGMRGLTLEGDPYVTGEFSRDEGKLAFNIGLNARTPQSAIGAITEQLRCERKHAAKLFKAITSRNREVADAFGCDMGMTLMRAESDITLGAVKLSTDAGIPVAPVHDSMICPAKNGGQVADFMAAAMAKLFGAINPCHVTIKGQNVPHMGKRVFPVVCVGGGFGGPSVGVSACLPCFAPPPAAACGPLAPLGAAADQQDRSTHLRTLWWPWVPVAQQPDTVPSIPPDERKRIMDKLLARRAA
jgi:hypothetical protein